MCVQHETLLNLLCEVNKELEIQMKKMGNKFSNNTMIVIGQIKQEPGISISEIARKTGIAKSHVCNTVEYLNQNGWVEKQPDLSDQRILRLFLNEQEKQTNLTKCIESMVVGVENDRIVEMIEGLKEMKASLVKLRET